VSDEFDRVIYNWEIVYGTIPLLQPITATMEMAIEYWMKHEHSELLLEQLKDYDMIEVEVTII
jgi:hypothetical protein